MKELAKDFLFGLVFTVLVLSLFFITFQLNLSGGLTASLYLIYALRIFLPVLGVVVLGKGIRKVVNFIRGFV